MNIDTQNNNVQYEQQAANPNRNPISQQMNMEIQYRMPTTPIPSASTPIAGSSQLRITRNETPLLLPIQTQPSPNCPIPVTPKNCLTNEQKLVVVRHCVAAVEDYKMIGKTEFLAIQREIIKCTERFDCSVEVVMEDILIQAKVH